MTPDVMPLLPTLSASTLHHCILGNIVPAEIYITNCHHDIPHFRFFSSFIALKTSATSVLPVTPSIHPHPDSSCVSRCLHFPPFFTFTGGGQTEYVLHHTSPDFPYSLVAPASHSVSILRLGTLMMLHAFSFALDTIR